MDIFMPLAICVIFMILFVICGWCCKRKREGTVYGYGQTVTVTSQPVHASPVVVPPYPVDPRHPTPHSGAPPPGFAAQNPPYPTNVPYPQAVPVPTYQTPPIGAGNTSPYPPAPTGSHPTPYPPAGGPDYNSRPPPYDVAVSQPPIQPNLPTKDGYSKQAPYNPNYGN